MSLLLLYKTTTLHLLEGSRISRKTEDFMFSV